jgi:hypothetical protein
VAKSAIGLPVGVTSPMTSAPSVNPSATIKPSTPPSPGNTQPVGKANAINLAWLPLDVEVIIRLKVRELWDSSMLTAVKESPETKTSLKIMQDELNMSPRDIDSVTVGLSGATELAMTGAADPTALVSAKDQAIIVVRTRLPFDPQIVEKRTDDFEDHRARRRGTLESSNLAG